VPRRDNLIIEQGTTWKVEWPVLDGAGQPLAVDGWTVHAQVRQSADSSVVLHEWSTAIANATAVGTKVALLVTPTVSSAWTWLTGVYDVELTNLAGQVTRIAHGTVRVSREVTRD
jgi:hypothetical protein